MILGLIILTFVLYIVDKTKAIRFSGVLIYEPVAFAVVMLVLRWFIPEPTLSYLFLGFILSILLNVILAYRDQRKIDRGIK